MNQELYNKLFARMDELGAIRKDLSLGCNVWEDYIYVWSEHYDWMDAAGFLHDDCSDDDEVIWHPPVLSDCNGAIYTIEKKQKSNWSAVLYFAEKWDNSKPYLHQQSDELGEKLFELLS